MSILERIRKSIPDGTELLTPVLEKTFTVFTNRDKVIFRVGKNKEPIPVPKPYWESIVNFLRGKGWVKIGTSHRMDVKKNTLEEYLDRCGNKGHSSWASYVVPVLEYLQIVEVDHKIPSKVRLK